MPLGGVIQCHDVHVLVLLERSREPLAVLLVLLLGRVVRHVLLVDVCLDGS